MQFRFLPFVLFPVPLPKFPLYRFFPRFSPVFPFLPVPAAFRFPSVCRFFQGFADFVFPPAFPQVLQFPPVRLPFLLTPFLLQPESAPSVLSIRSL